MTAVGSQRGVQAKGLLFALFGILLLSPDTLIIRLVDTDPWTFIAWRGALMAVGMTVIIVVLHGLATPARVIAIGWPGIVIAVQFAINNAAFQLSVQSTSVANTLAIIATAPLFAAIFSVILLREGVPLRTWIAIGLSLAGIALVFAGDWQAGGSQFGNVAALVTAIGLGGHFVLVRLARPRDMTPAIAAGGVLICLSGLVMAESIYVAPVGFGLLAVLGLVLLPVSFLLLTRAPRYISAPEVSLILLLETILGPLWVWLAIAETPPLLTLVGGGMIIVVLAVHAVLALRATSTGR